MTVGAANNTDFGNLFSNSVRRQGSDNSLGMDSFLTLMVAQMRNQDMMNPMNDTEFIAQLAQFSSLQAMQDLTALNATAYSVGLLGKEVTVARMDNSGNLATKTGVVTGIGLFEGNPIVYIGDSSYSLQEIMVVGKLPGSEEQPPENATPDPEPDPEPDIEP